MMKTTLAGCFLAVVMLAGLLMTSFAIAQKQDQAEERMQGAHQRQPVEGGIQPDAKALLNQGDCTILSCLFKSPSFVKLRPWAAALANFSVSPLLANLMVAALAWWSMVVRPGFR